MIPVILCCLGSVPTLFSNILNPWIQAGHLYVLSNNKEETGEPCQAVQALAPIVCQHGEIDTSVSFGKKMKVGN